MSHEYHTSVPATLSPQRVAIVEEALSWLGTPYHSHARIKGVGVDCVHLLCAVLEAAGVLAATDPGWYRRDWHLHRSEEAYADAIDARCERTARPRPGDVALFRFGRTLSHGAIWVSEDELVHAYVGRGVMVSRGWEAPLAGRDVVSWDISTLRPAPAPEA